MFTIDDLEVSEDMIKNVISEMAELRSNYPDVRLRTFGKNPIQLDQVAYGIDRAWTAEQVANTTRYLIRAHAHASAFIRQLPSLLCDPNWDYTFRSSNIESVWTEQKVSGFVSIREEAIGRLLEPLGLEQLTDDEACDYFPYKRPVWRFKEPRLRSDFIGNPDNSLLVRALWEIRRRELYSVLNNTTTGFSYTKDSDGNVLLSVHRTYLYARKLPEGIAKLQLALNVKPSGYEYRKAREGLLIEQVNYQSQEDRRRARMNSEKFANYWNDLKSNITAQDPGVAHLEFAQIPILEPGTESSRTWGIEIETVRADDTHRPRGWDSRYDGSLPNGEDWECYCECDRCYNGDHCEDTSDDCHYSDSDASSREFVSPILQHFNSDGLRQLCNDLGTDPNESPAPGIHVHVGAGDLTIPDVTNLLLSYSAIERLLNPLMHRKEYGYCQPTATDTLRGWLAKVREIRRGNDTDLSPSTVARQLTSSRYYDVNVHALGQHGTIEFRAMGAWYDYDHLVRWAWLVRELVNVSRLGIDQREWTRCRSIADVIAVLRKYGSEIPSDKLIDDALNTKSFDLASERSAEDN